MDEDASKTYSPSRLDTYRNCPRQYKFRYLDRIPRKTKTVEAYLGTCVHAALESLYDARMHGKTPTEAEVLAVYESAWDKGAAGESLVFHDCAYTIEDWRNVGRDCIKNYYRMYQPFDQDRTVAVERRVGFPLAVEDSDTGAYETYRIEGFVDRLALAPDGAMEIHDYKTGKTLPTQEHLDREDWQLPLYQMAVHEAWPDVPAVRLRWHYLRPGKTLTSTRAPEALKSLRREVGALIRTIKQDRAFEPVKSALCDWCEYRDICPLWKHAEAVAQLPEASRRRESGVALVDQYAAFEHRKKALRADIAAIESEQEDLARRVLDYAQEQELLSVAGTDAALDVHSKEEFHFPTKTRDPEKHDLIESELKRTSAWPEVSKLDSHALMDGFREKRWPADVLRLVEGWMGSFIRREIVRTVRLRRRKDASEE